jgi:hypothetical protein
MLKIQLQAAMRQSHAQKRVASVVLTQADLSVLGTTAYAVTHFTSTEARFARRCTIGT